MKKVHVIRHLAFEDLGNIQPVLDQFGAEVTYIEAGQESIGTDINDCDLLVILGGPIGVYEEEDYPFILDELLVIKQRITSKKALLGICLGAQLIARAMGSKVYPGHHKEIGWGRLEFNNQINNPLAALGEQAILHWHGDTFELPLSATLLASNDNYPNQAFAIENFCLAVQFHPEVTVAGMERWFIGHTAEIAATDNVSVTSLRQESHEVGRTLQPLAQDVWINWFKQLPW